MMMMMMPTRRGRRRISNHHHLHFLLLLTAMLTIKTTLVVEFLVAHIVPHLVLVLSSKKNRFSIYHKPTARYINIPFTSNFEFFFFPFICLGASLHHIVVDFCHFVHSCLGQSIGNPFKCKRNVSIRIENVKVNK